MQLVITGANRGIGLGLARLALARGHQVVATARDVSRALDLARLAGPALSILPLDVRSSESVRALAQRVGPLPVDVLINNAGVYGEDAPLEDLDVASLIETYRINAVGPLEVVRALLPSIRRGQARKIVNISSRMASIADNSSGGSYGYRMSKAALNMATKSLAQDLADQRIIVVAMNPGWVRTDMGGSHAPTSVEDSANGILDQIELLTLEDSGSFVDYAGRGSVPW